MFDIRGRGLVSRVLAIEDAVLCGIGQEQEAEMAAQGPGAEVAGQVLQTFLGCFTLSPKS